MSAWGPACSAKRHLSTCSSSDSPRMRCLPGLGRRPSTLQADLFPKGGQNNKNEKLHERHPARAQMGHSLPVSISSSWRCSDGVDSKTLWLSRRSNSSSVAASWATSRPPNGPRGSGKSLSLGAGAVLGATGGRGTGALGRGGGLNSVFSRFGTGPESLSPCDNSMCCFSVRRKLKLWPQVGQAKRPCSGGGFSGLGRRSFCAARCARTLGAPVGFARPVAPGVYSRSRAPGATAFRRYSAKVRPLQASLALDGRSPQVCAASPTSANMPSFRRSPSSPATVDGDAANSKK